MLYLLADETTNVLNNLVVELSLVLGNVVLLVLHKFLEVLILLIPSYCLLDLLGCRYVRGDEVLIFLGSKPHSPTVQ